MIRNTIVLIAILMISFSCSSPEQTGKSIEQVNPKNVVESIEEEEEWVPEVYKTSELAELMRQMHTDHMDLKHKIEKGELALEKQNDYRSIHQAIPTDPNDDTPLFHTYADAYLIADSIVYSSKTSSDYKENFNNMVNSCVACHENFCMGPINKIELLRIQ